MDGGWLSTGNIVILISYTGTGKNGDLSSQQAFTSGPISSSNTINVRTSKTGARPISPPGKTRYIDEVYDILQHWLSRGCMKIIFSNNYEIMISEKKFKKNV